MDSNEAKRILLNIYDGIDPNTGEILPEDHLCRSMKVACALHIAIRAIDGVKIGVSEIEKAPRSRRTTRRPREKNLRQSDEKHGLKKTNSVLGNSGTRWTQEEIDLLVYMHGKRKRYEEMGKSLRRTAFEVEEKLRMMKLI